jgi:hypothetical protein
MKKAVDKALLSKAVTTKEQFKCELEKSGIAVLFRTNAEGRTYGITFIDNHVRVVFNGSDLGKPYSATAILEKLSGKEDPVKPYRPGFTDKVASQEKYTHEAIDAPTNSMIQDLVTARDFDRSSPEAALKLGRKRRRRKGRKL